MPIPLRLILSLFTLAFVSCQPTGPLFDSMRARRDAQQSKGPVSEAALWNEVRLVKAMVPAGKHGRRVVRPMTPKYITVHSTQNYSQHADALRHALALKRGALRATKRPGGNRIGYLIWHFSVDDRMAVQHMPTNEQGEHADFDGPGNRLSIGIEMCENRGSSMPTTVNRTAMLCALLMKRHGIPLSHVVPHQHWPRRGCRPAHKNCPNFLMNDGEPGGRWDLFLELVEAYRDRLD